MNNEIKEILDTPIFIIDDEGFTVYINDKINNYITNLQQENERLKKSNKILEENWEHYMMKCGKAIEYIEKEIYYCLSSGDNINIYLDNLLNILQNGSDEK